MFSKSDLKKNFSEFLTFYKNRPIRNNQSGMKIDHCYALFTLLKKIKPKGFEVKKLWEYSDFQQKRISVFDEIEEKINSISPLLLSAKNETAEYYNENPGSYAVVYSTDYIFELLDEIEAKLNRTE